MAQHARVWPLRAAMCSAVALMRLIAFAAVTSAGPCAKIALQMSAWPRCAAMCRAERRSYSSAASAAQCPGGRRTSYAPRTPTCSEKRGHCSSIFTQRMWPRYAAPCSAVKPSRSTQATEVKSGCANSPSTTSDSPSAAAMCSAVLPSLFRLAFTSWKCRQARMAREASRRPWAAAQCSTVPASGCVALISGCGVSDLSWQGWLASSTDRQMSA
mmetsp:Transcript_90638/g.252078  ORF Transcript_90638/g.252078 Transcript_90638/m.252078 type:complete len:214 (+) Transcript_90638:56-697(+)